MDLSNVMARVEGLGLPISEGGTTLSADDRETVQDCLGFVQGFYDLLEDVGLLAASDEFNIDELEAAYNALLGENAAAALFLAHFKDAASMLRNTADKIKDDTVVPPLVINGYRKLADRVERTRERMNNGV
jgi:hypothetical protein